MSRKGGKTGRWNGSRIGVRLHRSCWHHRNIILIDILGPAALTNDQGMRIDKLIRLLSMQHAKGNTTAAPKEISNTNACCVLLSVCACYHLTLFDSILKSICMVCT